MPSKFVGKNRDLLPWNRVPELLKDTFTGFVDQKAMFHGAALAYYTVLALVPMIYLSFSFLGRILGDETINEILKALFESRIGFMDSDTILDLASEFKVENQSIVFQIFGVLALLMVSSALIVFFKHSINTFYNIQVKYDNRKKKLVKNILFRLISMGLIALITILVILFYFSQAFFISMIDQFFSMKETFEIIFIEFIKHLFSLVMNILIFLFVFKYLHDGFVKWKLAFFGAVATGILLYFGQLLINYYLLNFFFGAKSGGVAGILFILLAYVYYSSQIIFFGAKFIAVYAEKVGKPIKFKQV